MYFAVFAMTKHQDQPSFVGYQGGTPRFAQAPRALEWHIVGVFETDSAEKACQAAAKKAERFGSFFAVEGFPWGIDLLETEATEFGADPQPMSRLKQLENRSRETEKEAGIG